MARARAHCRGYIWIWLGLNLVLAWPAAATDDFDSIARRDATRFRASANYVHRWIDFPVLEGTDLSGAPFRQEPAAGVLDVVVFVASWCVQCQQIAPAVVALDQRHRKESVRFTYIFAHDLVADAQGFARAFEIPQGVVAAHSILKAFHNPELPAIYLADRHGWLLSRYLAVQPGQLAEIEETIQMLTDI